MSKLEKDEINHELDQIENRLAQIRGEIRLLESERESLLTRKKECQSLLKDIVPSSSGGNKNDNSSNWKRTDFKWSSQVDICLKETFKLNSFRPLQLETINVTLSNLDCMVIMPTGGGKSLCFQLPAVLDPGLTLVVSPLVSLMEDQLWILKALNINADTINASSSKEHIKQIQSDMVDSESDLKLLYVTPEKLAKSKIFMNKLQKAYEMKRFTRLVIDEVHCCSTYGHDFRPDYKFLGVMKQVFPNICILGLTATATQPVIDDVKKILNLSKCVLFKASFNRPNIFYEVREKSSNNDECIYEIANTIKNRFPNQSGIVYCFSQKESEQVATDLCSRGIKADCYHAQMDSKQRTKVHEKWLKNQVNVIVATIAFGMGIDKADCKFVIHHSLSKSLENFYQESGRAGRDGLPAYSILFYRFGDVFRQSSMVFTEQTGLINLYSMVNYCIDFQTCKRNLIAKHFNDDLWDKTGECNQMCDYCKNLSRVQTEMANCIMEVNLICQIIDKNTDKSGKDKRVTANKLVELVASELNGGKSKSANKLSNNHLTKIDLENLILTMLMKKYLREDFHFTPYNTICYVINGPKSGRLDYENEFFINIRSSPGLKRSKSITNGKVIKESPVIVANQTTKLEPNIITPVSNKPIKSIDYKNSDINDDDCDNGEDDDCQLIFDQDDVVALPKNFRKHVVEEILSDDEDNINDSKHNSKKLKSN